MSFINHIYATTKSLHSHLYGLKGRISIEVAYEAILDAGIHPQSLRGSKTGVFAGVCFSEAEKTFNPDQSIDSGFLISG